MSDYILEVEQHLSIYIGISLDKANLLNDPKIDVRICYFYTQEDTRINMWSHPDLPLFYSLYEVCFFLR